MYVKDYEIIGKLTTDNSGTAKWGFAKKGAETVFIVDEQKRQISLPQILFKSILRCKLDQLMHTGEKTLPHFFGAFFLIKMLHDPRHIFQYFSIFKIAI